MPVTISFTDPRTTSHITESGSWFASGMDKGSLRLAATQDNPVNAVADLCKKHRAGSVTFVGKGKAGTDQLVCGKGVVSSHERFILPVASGWYITDHTRNALAQLVPADRKPSPLALVEHYIFRATHGDRSYAAKIIRLTHGEVLFADLPEGQPKKKLVDRIAPPQTRLDRKTGVDTLDKTLGDAMTFGEEDGKVCLLFSGGADSALLATYLDEQTTFATWVPNTPEFAGETEYARSAAELLDISIAETHVDENTFPDLLQSTTHNIGIPAMHYATPMSIGIYDGPYDTFLTGEGSDALFGVGMRLGKVSGWLSNPLAVAALGFAKKFGPAQLRHRLSQLHELAPRLAMEPGPRSYALGGAGSPIADQMGDILGMDIVVESLQDKLDFVEQRVELEAPAGDVKLRNHEYRHWAFTLADPVISERHKCQARGKAYHSPFGSAGVIETAIAVPVAIRYARGLRGKWLVKELLGRRSPGYPIDQRKKHTAIPFERYYADGPLQDIWDRYEIPEIFTGKSRDEMVAGNRLTWQAISYAVWDAHVGSNATLTPHRAAAEHTFR